MVEIDKKALEKLYKEIGDKILAVDKKFRAEHHGEDAEALAPLAGQAFSMIGVNLTDDQLAEYAASVSEGKDFEFVLQ